ncbi:hypothetical protein [Mesorhizobium sp. LNJC394B00]|uniref:hypothetical protein n=1 Tax=Mesorhizobium sp. LNJC394B00 TaxID=1287274 RepID=UPI0003CEF2D6|nr:hypothetical protein [Mesorhizobium sp. LNJC394B00]ESY21424.1 hypothetical protein X750_16850 [Mesorhizobium sp. LNJC394B00]
MAAAASKVTLFEGVLGLAVAVSVGLLSVIVGYQISQAGTLGEHSEKLNALQASITTRIDTLETNLSAKLDDAGATQKTILKAMDVNANDPTKLLVQMGVIGQGDAFAATVHDGGLWVIPVQDAVAAKIEKAGLKRQQINNGVTGYRVLDLKAMAPPSLSVQPQ